MAGLDEGLSRVFTPLIDDGFLPPRMLEMIVRQIINSAKEYDNLSLVLKQFLYFSFGYYSLLAHLKSYNEATLAETLIQTISSMDSSPGLRAASHRSLHIFIRAAAAFSRLSLAYYSVNVLLHNDVNSGDSWGESISDRRIGPFVGEER